MHKEIEQFCASSLADSREIVKRELYTFGMSAAVVFLCFVTGSYGVMQS
jgi:hypothetical protein